ncbi:MAG: hypothetical protein AAF479_03095 [Pseudomonadota bacterium]
MQLYYRHRQNGVTVFRMEVANRQRRIELNQIASILHDGRIVPHKRRPATDAELTEIEAWHADWKRRSGDEELTETEQFVAELNQFTDWVARRAPAEQVDRQSDLLLTALLDLRQTVVRRISQLDAPLEDDDEGE